MSIEDIWRVFHDRMQAFVIRRMENASDAEDVLQEIYIRIHRNIDSLEKKDRVEAWMYQIARNAIVDHYRSKNRRMKHDEHLATLSVEDIGAEHGHEEESAQLRNEMARCLEPMMARLRSDQREALALTSFEGLTQKEAAKRLDLSESGMKSRVQRGRQQLKAMLLDCCRIEFDRRGGAIDYEHREESDCCRGHDDE